MRLRNWWFIVIRHDNFSPSEWKLGCILIVYLGSDSKVQVADVRTDNDILTRSIVLSFSLFVLLFYLSMSKAAAKWFTVDCPESQSVDEVAKCIVLKSLLCEGQKLKKVLHSAV